MEKLKKHISQNLFKTKKTAHHQKVANNFHKKEDKKILGSTIHIVSLSSIFGMVLGGILSFIYLQNIGLPSIFPEVINQPSSLITILLVFGLITFMIFTSFSAPCFIFSFLSDFKEFPLILDFIKTKLIKNTIPLSFFSLIWPIIFYLVFVFLIQNCDSLPKDGLTILFYVTILLPIPFSLFFWNKFISKSLKNLWNQKKNWLFLMGILFFISFFMSSYPILIYLSIATWLPEGNLQFLYLYLVGILLLADLFLITTFATTYTKKDKHKYLIIPAFFTLFLFILTPYFTSDHSNFSTRILNVVRFTELPQNASWYLLHNNFQKNDGSQESSGIEPNDLQRLKQVFKHPKSENTCSRLDYRNNALFGYMAWNLGNTKVFCPSTVSNISKKENEHKKLSELSEKCLVINTQFLQPIPNNYIGTNWKFDNNSVPTSRSLYGM
ncbi:acyltransferase family protein [Neisseria chenwenguii]|nr:hypothetical protein [Neisseria chenwenguii]